MGCDRDTENEVEEKYNEQDLTDPSWNTGENKGHVQVKSPY